MKQYPVALQTYSVRDHLCQDYESTLAKIAKIGYSQLEIGGFGPYSSEEWNKVLQKFNLSILANHLQIEMLEESFNHLAEFNTSIGCTNIICPYLREERRQDLDGYKQVAKTLNAIGKKCREKGFDFHYHNHAFEFTKFGDECGFDILLNETDPEFVFFEVDTCWVKFGGQDPAQFLRRLNGRCKLVHLKDLEEGTKLVFREVGEGILNFADILAACHETAVTSIVVEQDTCPADSLVCVERSFANIAKLQEPGEGIG